MQSSLEKDRRTLEAIGLIYCKAHHADAVKDAAGLCSSCQDCDIHCQRGEAQERIKEIMRYSAPRMAYRHPLMTAEYLRKKIKGKRKSI